MWGRVPGTKIAVPDRPDGFVPRTSLRDTLDRATDVPVTLVCAPAGYGKTLLLADWVATTGAADKAWVSLDDDDNHVDRFWSAVLSAFAECAVVPPDSRLRELSPPERVDTDFLAEVVDALDLLTDPVFLVLDDFHKVLDRDTLHDVTTLVRDQPLGLRLVLASRFDPPLPLARLRPQGRLAELRADRLRFSVEDSGRLLRAGGVTLDPDQTRRLAELTDGWAAGLRLAVRSLRDADDPDAFLADFAAGDRSVADYLVGEVIGRMPAEHRRFLREISVCDEVTPELAEALTGRRDAGMVLDALAWDNSLVVGTGTSHGWYHVHPVLRAYLRGQLNRRRPELSAKLHDAAAAWFAAADQPDVAVEHARQSGQRQTVAGLLRDHGLTLLLRGEHRIVRSGLDTVGTRLVATDSLLGLLSAFAHAQDGELATAKLELAGVPDTGALTTLLAATVALSEDGVPAVAPIAELLRDHADDERLAAWTRSVLGRALLCRGDRADARRELLAAQAITRERGFDHLAVHNEAALAAVLALDGDYPAMAVAGAKSVAAARRSGGPEFPSLAAGHAMLGLAALFRAEPDVAAAHADQAGDALPDVPPPMLRFAVELLDAAARFDTGDRRAGLSLLRQARRRLADDDAPPQLIALAALISHQTAVRLRHELSTREVTDWARTRLGDTAEVALLATWNAMAKGDVDGARQALHGVLDVEPLVPLTPVEGRLVATTIAIGAHERTHARQSLAAALTLAEPVELIRPFEYAQPVVRQLLVDQMGGFGAAEAFAGRVHVALSARSDGHGEDALTGQERVVLAHLASQRSLGEIAAGLEVSVNTVKTHVRAIYTKLRVNSRRAAVVAARERGLA